MPTEASIWGNPIPLISFTLASAIFSSSVAFFRVGELSIAYWMACSSENVCVAAGCACCACAATNKNTIVVKVRYTRLMFIVLLKVGDYLLLYISGIVFFLCPLRDRTQN